MIRTAFAALVLLALPMEAMAQNKQAETGQPPKRVRSVTLTQPDQKCPESTADEIIVCSKVEDPYRIPKDLRDSGPIPSSRQAWTNRLAADEESARTAAGLPNTCSPVGSGGQTGCAQAAARAWAAARRAQANGQSDQ